MNILKQKIKFLLIILLFFSLIFPFKLNAEDLKPNEFEEIKNSRFFVGQVGSVFSSLDQTKEMILKNKDEIEEMAEMIEEKKEIIEEKEKIKSKILRELYINSGGQKIIHKISLVLGIKNPLLGSMILKSAYQKNITQINQLKKDEERSQEELDGLYLKRSELQNQIDYLEEELAKIKESDIKIIEDQIINTDIMIYPQNNREFIGWDKVDFDKKDSVTIYGSGTAHGIGMSQYGAKAMAEKGVDYQQILKHYYQGTEIKKFDTEKMPIRIKISSSSSGGNITVKGGEARLEKNGVFEKILNSGEKVQSLPGTKLVPNQSSTFFEIDYKMDRFRSYRGVIEIITNENGGITTINSVYIEEYLKSVISGEMSASWPLEALKAQAIAARNYAIKNINPSKNYDLCDTPACQVYLGISHEFPSTNLAIEETKGQVLYYGNELITAYYFSSSGGWTENNENIWGGSPRPYLRGVASPDENSPYNNWKTNPINKYQLEEYLNKNQKTSVGEIKSIEIIKRGVSGRVMAVKLIGSKGEKIVSGSTFKTIVNLGLPDGEKNYIKEILFGIK